MNVCRGSPGGTPRLAKALPCELWGFEMRHVNGHMVHAICFLGTALGLLPGGWRKGAESLCGRGKRHSDWVWE